MDMIPVITQRLLSGTDWKISPSSILAVYPARLPDPDLEPGKGAFSNPCQDVKDVGLVKKTCLVFRDWTSKHKIIPTQKGKRHLPRAKQLWRQSFREKWQREAGYRKSSSGGGRGSGVCLCFVRCGPLQIWTLHKEGQREDRKEVAEQEPSDPGKNQMWQVDPETFTSSMRSLCGVLTHCYFCP